MKKIIKDIISILTVILLVNIFSFFIFFRWDFTKTKRYSLSKVSKTSIRNNVEPIVVDFYVTEDLPQDTKKLVKEFRSLLKEYKSLSNVSFTINTIYPDNTEKEFKATQEGIIPSFNEKGIWRKSRKFIAELYFISATTRPYSPTFHSIHPLNMKLPGC